MTTKKIPPRARKRAPKPRPSANELPLNVHRPPMTPEDAREEIERGERHARRFIAAREGAPVEPRVKRLALITTTCDGEPAAVIFVKEGGSVRRAGARIGSYPWIERVLAIDLAHRNAELTFGRAAWESTVKL